jgi:hypothetical protein
MFEKNNQDALVLEPGFGENLISLGKQMPIWIIDSTQNRSVVEKIRNTEFFKAEITTFQARKQESLAMACERILQSLDEHYNECSQTPGYSELMVIGVSLDDVSLKPFLELNFNQFLRTATGFIAKKSSQ